MGRRRPTRGHVWRLSVVKSDRPASALTTRTRGFSVRADPSFSTDDFHCRLGRTEAKALPETAALCARAQHPGDLVRVIAAHQPLHQLAPDSFTLLVGGDGHGRDVAVRRAIEQRSRKADNALITTGHDSPIRAVDHSRQAVVAFDALAPPDTSE